MKRKLLITPLLVTLLIVFMLPTFASEEATNTGVTVTNGVGTPGKEVRLLVSVRSTFADNVGLVINYDEEVLTMTEESRWLIDGENELADVNVANGMAVWGADAMELKGKIFEIVFQVNENAEIGATTEVKCRLRAKWSEDTQLDGVASATVSVKNIAKITGTVSSYGDETALVTVELLNGESVVSTAILENGESVYEFEVEQGTYVIRVSKTMHCPREYEVSMEDLEDKVQDAEIRLYGDVTGDEEVDVLDAMEVLKYSTEEQSVITNEDVYVKQMADVTGDEEIDVLDAMEIVKYSTEEQSVFDSLK